ncbi:PAS domain-containing protein [bacterium]|nr:PAS domain-containing protein [bacterium]
MQKHIDHSQSASRSNLSMDWVNVFEAIGHPTLILDPDHCILKANKATIAATGVDEDSLLGKKCYEVFHGTNEPPCNCPMLAVNDSGEFNYGEMEVQGLGGWYMVSCTPVFDDSSEFSNIIHITTDISLQKEAERKIASELKEKNVLLREIHHRVKNNLQVISSLINLQIYQLADPTLKDAFEETQNRIRSMAFIHQELYQAESFAEIPLDRYIDHLVSHLYRAYNLNQEIIDITINTNGVKLSMDYAMPLGLILNELISNVFKYAFPEEQYLPGKVEINLQQRQDDCLELSFKDNGIGIPSDLDIHNNNSFGMYLISLLVEDQLKGRIEVLRKAGTEFKISIPAC